ncbi:hypothetical protein [Pseudoalteromonas sp. MTN2-4]|uniref:hypothetical protein n=1 Tax=Pseudoalteromonas sp. MTN2-4 TaxID=3056555 RepID=UPI0036F3E798
MKNITERQLQILEHLAEFKYLTTDQVMGLLGNSGRPYILQLLNGLSDGKRPLTRFKDLGFYPGAGRLPRMHFLTPYGVNFLVENLDFDPDKVKAPKERTPLFQRDFFHRVFTIDFNIFVRKFCKKNQLKKVFFDYYFDQIGSQRNSTAKAKNALTVGDFQIIPDGIGKITDGENEKLFLFEQHNGNDSKRAIKQIYSHVEAIGEGLASEKYDYPKGVRVFYVFENEACARSVAKRMQEDNNLREHKEFFLFSTNDLIRKKFDDWYTFDGEKRSFF